MCFDEIPDGVEMYASFVSPDECFATDQAVAIVADAGDRVFEQVAVAGLVQRAEAQGVEIGDGPRAHCKDVAEDAADAGGGALERLHGRRMVMRFDFEDDA